MAYYVEDEVRTMCESGVDSYLASKHKEHLAEGLETGLLGAFIGTILTIGVSYLDSSNTIKMTHAWLPATIGFSSALVASYTTRTRDDESHIDDFNKVCDAVITDVEDDEESIN